MEQHRDDILDIRDLRKWYPLSRGLFSRKQEAIRAVNDVTFTVRRGEVLGLVGESGSGKSTLGRTILRLADPTGGNIIFDGQDITRLARRQLKPIRRRMQLIFQDPFSSLNPRMTVGRIVAAPLLIHGKGRYDEECRAKVAEALQTVGLSER